MMPKNNNKTRSFSDPQIEQFIYLVSHGLRSPLTNIRWGLEMFKKNRVGDLSQEQIDFASDLHEFSRELTDILGSMIVLTHLLQDRFDLYEEDINLQKFLQQFYSHKSDELQKKGITYSVSCPADLYVRTDKLLLGEILSNIMLSYAYATEEPSNISMEARTEDDSIKICLQCPSVHMPILEHYGISARSSREGEFVGGTPGLLIYLAKVLAEYIKTEVELIARDDVCLITVTLPLNSTT